MFRHKPQRTSSPVPAADTDLVFQDLIEEAAFPIGEHEEGDEDEEFASEDDD